MNEYSQEILYTMMNYLSGLEVKSFKLTDNLVATFLRKLHEIVITYIFLCIVVNKGHFKNNLKVIIFSECIHFC